MNIMVPCVVRRDVLKWVPRQRVSTVVIDGLDSRPSEEQETLTSIHSCNFVCNAGAQRVQEEAFERVIVQCTKRVWHVETMMAGMECVC